MKIQFIITGWYYNQDSLIDGLISISKDNENIDVFYACHKEPPAKIQANLKWKLYPNLGMADGGYEQALQDLKLDDDTICFFLQDDIIIKNWDFIYACLDKFRQGYKFIGNCTNFPTIFNPNQLHKGLNIPFKDFVKQENRHWYSSPLQIKTLRSSFICTKYQYVREMGFFEPCFDYPEYIEPYEFEPGQFRTKGEKGLGGMGNLILALFSYKVNAVHGTESITYLSNKYLDSEYIYECARGAVDAKYPMS